MASGGIKPIPGKEMGIFARLDAEGRELVYIGLGELVMHRDVMDRIDADFARLFGSEKK